MMKYLQLIFYLAASTRFVSTQQLDSMSETPQKDTTYSSKLTELETVVDMKPVLPDSLSCRVRGDPLVETYDGKWLVLVGTEKYLLTQLNNTDNCDFIIYIKTSSLSDRDQVDNLRIDLPSSDLYGRDLLINESDGIVNLVTSCDLDLTFNPSGKETVVTVKVPLSHGGHLTGLCGDANGELDDLKTKDGVDVSADPGKNEKISESYAETGNDVDYLVHRRTVGPELVEIQQMERVLKQDPKYRVLETVEYEPIFKIVGPAELSDIHQEIAENPENQLENPVVDPAPKLRVIDHEELKGIEAELSRPDAEVGGVGDEGDEGGAGNVGREEASETQDTKG